MKKKKILSGIDCHNNIAVASPVHCNRHVKVDIFRQRAYFFTGRQPSVWTMVEKANRAWKLQNASAIQKKKWCV